MEMGFIEKRSGRYRARYRDPLGSQRSETFTRKADAERFLRGRESKFDLVLARDAVRAAGVASLLVTSEAVGIAVPSDHRLAQLEAVLLRR